MNKLEFYESITEKESVILESIEDPEEGLIDNELEDIIENESGEFESEEDEIDNLLE